MNEKVDIYRYVVKNTFDAYLWQIVENKQRFISQVMRGDIGVRNCDDMDETTLSFAEIKACATGDERIKEKMELDIKVQRLSALKAAHLKNKLGFENVIRDYPIKEKQIQSAIQKVKEDIAIRDANVQDDFSMKIRNMVFDERTKAGKMLFEVCKQSVEGDVLGEYRGFVISKYGYDDLIISAKGKYRMDMGFDPVGVTMRIDHAINGLEKHIEANEAKLDTLQSNYSQAVENVDKPFAREEELLASIQRQNELDAELNLSANNNSVEADAEVL